MEVSSMGVLRVATRVWAARVVATALILALGGAAPRAFAAEPIPIAKLSLDQRLTTAPDSTVVRIRPRLTTTLGKLRAAHRGRKAAFANARLAGIRARNELKAKPMLIARPAVTLNYGAGPTPTPVTYRQHMGGLPIPTPRVYPQKSNLGNPSLPTPAPAPTPIAIVESASQYASAPPDMKAFCYAAQASACAYLPAQSSGYFINGQILDYDWLITQSQCGQEGGQWLPDFSFYCQFSYPPSVRVNFTPAKSYRLQQSASCDSSLWSYTVDPHGAISIQYKNPTEYSAWSATNNPTCVVRVAVGP
jgi:hypothetical protein